MGGGLIGGALSLGSSIIGGKKDRKAMRNAQSAEIAMMEAAQERLKPFLDTGYRAGEQLEERVLGEDAPLMRAFTYDNYIDDPSYQFQLDEGMRALNNRQSASGNLYSGKGLRDLMRFGQGLASQNFGDAWQRDFNKRNQDFDMLNALTQRGVNSATATGDIDQRMGSVRSSGIRELQNSRNDSISGVMSAFGYNNAGNRRSFF